jgi:CRISPR-associated protein Cas5a/b/c
MIGLRVEGVCHWGYWSRVPGANKLQPSIPVPPPTTLIGALSFPLARKGLIGQGGQIGGEFIVEERPSHKWDFKSSASILEPMVLACAAALKGTAIHWEDLNKYTTLLYQKTSKDTDEEKAAGGRRYLQRYLTGAVRTGKVFYPSGALEVLYLLDEKAVEEFFQSNWQSILAEASWTITRIGSKESLFSVNQVEIMRPTKTSGKIKTKFYFKSNAGNPELGEIFYREEFWQGGWGRNDPAVFTEYIIPGRRAFIQSKAIMVEDVKTAYQFGQEALIIAG